MRFSVYLPPEAEYQSCPVLWWLSGLTCTDENFMQKAGAQQVAAEQGLILVAPDTSPRGLDLPGEHDSWDFGSGAGFYLDATQSPWSEHYRMFSYVTDELPELVAKHFNVDVERQSISGHSMGGHGALICGLKHPGRYLSIGAFSPIAAPSQCPWGKKAFSAYLGDDKTQWAQWDAAELLEQASLMQPMRVEQGLADEFLAEQLLPDKMLEAAYAKDFPLEYHPRAGYDHSYYFIATFIKEHINWHLRYLHSAGSD